MISSATTEGGSVDCADAGACETTAETAMTPQCARNLFIVLSRSVVRSERAFLRSLLWIASLFIVINLSAGLCTHYLFTHADPTEIRAVSSNILESEYALFGVYPHFAITDFFSQWPSMDALIVLSYQHLPMVIFFVMILALFLKEVRPIRLFLISFFIAYVLAVPLWLSGPALSPLEFQIENTLAANHSSASAAAVASFSENGLGESGDVYLEQLKDFWIDPTGQSFGITANPSMHTAFATILLAAAYRVRFWLGLIITPWYLLCIIGTVYTLQHYITDIVTGLLVAAASLLLATLFLRLDSKYLINGDFRISPKKKLIIRHRDRKLHFPFNQRHSRGAGLLA